MGWRTDRRQTLADTCIMLYLHAPTDMYVYMHRPASRCKYKSPRARPGRCPGACAGRQAWQSSPSKNQYLQLKRKAITKVEWLHLPDGNRVHKRLRAPLTGICYGSSPQPSLSHQQQSPVQPARRQPAIAACYSPWLACVPAATCCLLQPLTTRCPASDSDMVGLRFSKHWNQMDENYSLGILARPSHVSAWAVTPPATGASMPHVTR